MNGLVARFVRRLICVEEISILCDDRLTSFFWFASLLDHARDYPGVAEGVDYENAF